MLRLEIIKRTHPWLLKNMENHYSKPLGFVGRNICYAIYYSNYYYGGIVGGSAVGHLVGRNEFFNFMLGVNNWHREQIVNNIFYHVKPLETGYPARNFTQLVIKQFRKQIQQDWFDRYSDEVKGYESLVELPRSGEIYIRDKWIKVGTTKGYTCKRTGGYGTDTWSGARIWDTENLRPKLVFCRLI